MENKVKIELINKSRNKDKKAMDTLVLHYYETVGKKYIKKYPNKPYNQECAWRLCELSIEKYINEGLKSDITSYISAQFKRKYKEFQPHYEMDGNKNKEKKLKESIIKSLSNKEEYDKLLDNYQYILDRYINLYPNKKNKEICAEELFKEILKKYITEESTQLARYIKNYFAKNYESYTPGDKLKNLTPKVPVQEQIEKAREDSLSREELIVKYMYIVDDQIANIKGFDIEELKSCGYLKLVKLIDTYLNEKPDYSMTGYLITGINAFYKSYIKKEQERKENYFKYDIEKEQSIDITNDLIETIDIKNVIKKLNLKTREEKILACVAEYGYTFNEVGKVYGITRSRAQQIYQDNIGKIRKKIK